MDKLIENWPSDGAVVSLAIMKLLPWLLGLGFLVATPPALAANSAFKIDLPTSPKIHQIKLDADLGGGRLEVFPDASAKHLASIQVAHDQELRPTVALEGERLRMGVIRGRIFGGIRENNWKIHLSKKVRWDLALALGAAQATLELGGLAVREINVSAGAAQVAIKWSATNKATLERGQFQGGAARITVEGLGHANPQDLEFEGGAGSFVLDFSGPLDRRVRVRLAAGVGAVQIKVPRAVGIRIKEKDVALAHVELPGDLQAGSDGEKSQNYDSARGKIDLEIKAALGRIEIARI